MQLTGRLLLFDKKDMNGTIFPKDCTITIPGKCPVLMEFKADDPTSIIGSATVKKDDIGLTCDIDLFRFDPETMRSVFNDNIYVGGFYTGVESHDEGEVRVVDNMILRAVSLTLLPADPEYKVVEVKDEKEKKDGE
jgi:hypothetical protein